MYKISFLLIIICLLISCKQAEIKSQDQEQETKQFQSVTNTLKVACIGNSITEGYGIENPAENSYPAQMQRMLGRNYQVKNFGVSGRTLLRKGDFPYWQEEAFQEAKDFQPDIVVIKLGTNDTKPQNWKYSDEFVKDYQVFIDELQALYSKPKVYVCYPVPAFRKKSTIKDDIIRKEMIPFINEIVVSKGAKIINLYTALDGQKELFPDGIHPNKAGAKVIAATVAKAIKD